MLGYLDFGLGTDAVEETFGVGGGMAGMVIPLIPGMVAGKAVETTLSKL